MAWRALKTTFASRRAAQRRPGKANTRRLFRAFAAGELMSPASECALIPCGPVSRARRKLPRLFYAPGPLAIARDLIGMHLLHDDGGLIRVGCIVDTEASMSP